MAYTVGPNVFTADKPETPPRPQDQACPIDPEIEGQVSINFNFPDIAPACKLDPLPVLPPYPDQPEFPVFPPIPDQCESIKQTSNISIGGQQTGEIHIEPEDDGCGFKLLGDINVTACETFTQNASINFSGQARDSSMTFTSNPTPNCGFDLVGDINIDACESFTQDVNIGFSGQQTGNITVTPKSTPDCGFSLTGSIHVDPPEEALLPLIQVNIGRTFTQEDPYSTTCGMSCLEYDYAKQSGQPGNVTNNTGGLPSVIPFCPTGVGGTCDSVYDPCDKIARCILEFYSSYPPHVGDIVQVGVLTYQIQSNYKRDQYGRPDCSEATDPTIISTNCKKNWETCDNGLRHVPFDHIKTNRSYVQVLINVSDQCDSSTGDHPFRIRSLFRPTGNSGEPSPSSYWIELSGGNLYMENSNGTGGLRVVDAQFNNNVDLSTCPPCRRTISTGIGLISSAIAYKGVRPRWVNALQVRHLYVKISYDFGSSGGADTIAVPTENLIPAVYGNQSSIPDNEPGSYVVDNGQGRTSGSSKPSTYYVSIGTVTSSVSGPPIIQQDLHSDIFWFPNAPQEIATLEFFTDEYGYLHSREGTARINCCCDCDSTDPGSSGTTVAPRP